MNTADKITILHCHDGYAAKIFHADGRIEQYRAGKYFRCEQRSCSSIHDLHSILLTLQDMQRAFIIRGEPIDGGELQHAIMRRTKANFRDVPRRSIMLDIDGVLLPSGMEPVSPEALAYVITLLPSVFHNVTFVAQWSNSAGLKPGVIKVHLWFWLSEPLGSAELRAWAKSLEGRIDPAVFNVVQPHYTARPLFHGIEDPAPARTLLVKLAKDAVSLVIHPLRTMSATKPTAPSVKPLTVTSLGNKIEDGREQWLRNERYRILWDERPETFEDFAEGVWASFAAMCETGPTVTSGNSYTFDSVTDKCRYDWEKFDRGEFDFQRVPAVTLPAFPDRTVALDVGQAQLQSLISDYMIKPRHMAIRVTSGAGKTSAVCREFVARHRVTSQQAQRLVLHAYLTRHDLKNEFAAILAKLAPELTIVNVIGRGSSNCDRWEMMPALHNMRVSVQRTCCDRTNAGELQSPVLQSQSRCPHFDTCGYQQQFRPADVYLFTKPNLHASPRGDVASPDFVVIDEEFISDLIEVREAGLEDLLKGISFASVEVREALKAIRDALAFGNSPLVALRQLGHDRDSLEELAHQLNELRLSRIRRVRPGMPAADIVDRIAAVGPESVAYLALLALSHEIGHPREDAYSVVYRDSKLAVRLLRESPALHHPTLILDATGDEELIKAVVPNVEYHCVDVPRKAHVVQVHNRRLSKFSMTEAEGKDQTLALIQQAIDRIGRRYRRVLLVTFKVVKTIFKLPPDWSVAHFGAIRGLDGYKDFDAVVLVGTYLPPVQAVEHEAGTLAARLPEQRKFTGQYTQLERAFRLRDGSGSATTWGHIDPFVQRVLEQKREAEMLQAIDRLRLVHALAPKPVFILSNTPLDLTVDELVTLEQLAGSGDYVGKLLDHFGGVIPLRASVLHERRPDLFPTEKAAEKWAQPFTPKPLIVPIRQTGVKELRAKAVGQKGPSKTRVMVREDHPAPRAAVTHHLGQLSAYDGPPDREAVVFVGVPGSTRTVGAKIVQYVDDGIARTGWKRIALPNDLYWVLNPPLIKRAAA